MAKKNEEIDIDEEIKRISRKTNVDILKSGRTFDNRIKNLEKDGFEITIFFLDNQHSCLIFIASADAFLFVGILSISQCPVVEIPASIKSQVQRSFLLLVRVHPELVGSLHPYPCSIKIPMDP